MPLQNFVDKVTVVTASWLNQLDVLKYTIFADAATKANARTALTSDDPLEIVNGGTGARTAADARSNLGLLAIGVQQTPKELAAGVTPTDLSYLPGCLRRYGATGLVTDTVTGMPAFTSALATGHAVTGVSGDTYWINPLVAAISDVVIDMTGCTIKLLKQTTAPGSGNYMLDLQADRILVRGGTWDGTKLDEEGELNHIENDAYYSYAAVRMRANNCTVDGIWSKDSIGIGIKGAGYDGHVVRNCKVTGYRVQGIFLENGSAADHYDWRVESNYIEMDRNTGVGIYLSAASPYTYVPQRWIVSNNVVIGPSSDSKADIDFCSSIFGSDGVCANNTWYGGCCGVSAVRTDNSTFTGNRFINQNIDNPFTAAFGLEISGGYNTISGNVFVGGNQGVAINALRTSSGNTIVGNSFKDQEGTSSQGGMGVFLDGSSQAVYGTNISNNSFSSTDSPWTGVYLAGLGVYNTLVSGNSFITLPAPNTIGVYIVNTTGSVSIAANKFAAVERPALLDGGTNSNITFVNNDCNETELTDPAALVDRTPGTVYGENVSFVGNAVGGVSLDYIDRAADDNVGIIHGWRSGNPNGVIAASVSSIILDKSGGASATMWIKESGSGNTGWRKVVTSS